MSDCFDHEQAAWDSLNDYGCEEDGSELHTYNSNPNYYHVKLKVVEYKRETDKSFLIKFETGKDFWIPKKIMRDIKDDSALFHLQTLKSIIDKEKE